MTSTNLRDRATDERDTPHGPNHRAIWRIANRAGVDHDVARAWLLGLIELRPCVANRLAAAAKTLGIMRRGR